MFLVWIVYSITLLNRGGQTGSVVSWRLSHTAGSSCSWGAVLIAHRFPNQLFERLHLEVFCHPMFLMCILYCFRPCRMKWRVTAVRCGLRRRSCSAGSWRPTSRYRVLHPLHPLPLGKEVQQLKIIPCFKAKAYIFLQNFQLAFFSVFSVIKEN